MKILVTGGAGYIGSICVEQLLDAGHTVTVFDNLTEGHRKAVDPRATLVIGDLQERAQINAALEAARPDAVMHFAANALVGNGPDTCALELTVSGPTLRFHADARIALAGAAMRLTLDGEARPHGASST